MSNRIVISEPSLPSLEELKNSLDEIWENRWLTNDGPFLQQFENALRGYLGAKHVAVQTNGHSSLEIGLRALDLCDGEVITTPYSFVSTSHAIRNVGAQVVFSDIDASTFNLDPLLIEEKINPRTRAILATHAYGLPCNLEALDEIATRHGLALIYDGAHSFGTTVEGNALSLYGDICMLSFHATKIFNSIEGGALVTANEETLNRVRLLRNFGISGPDEISGWGTNAKMNEILAAVGLLNLKGVEEEISRRTQVGQQYRTSLQGNDALQLLDPGHGIRWNHAYFPVLLDESFAGDDLKRIEAALRIEGVVCRRYFSVSINTIDVYRDCPGADECRVSEDLARRVICLPIHGRMSTQDAEEVSSKLQRLL
ncbi:DegT/DnrJ/EryC1/StrS family aminotransferase [Seongchinamella unica]|uniref:DegT/DnrJ/EryC1/StrS family aminotransferase n=1 Tax=Seongchinamella unica TaxID=2547392 RepID=A0A4R5LN28_9GAMM|nr:DegT/DnrJ/EryC1/StrS family aminotransferase [Seongchinamella unica]TDG11616.1 DegT/DnrJ/EryC1/StrS family aminotransferase [Seongchinamella unica]